MKALQKISEMVGQFYMYKKEVYAIRGFIPEEQKVRLKTDKQDIVLLEDGLLHHLTLFQEVEPEPGDLLPATVGQQLSATPQSGTLTELRDILMDNIRKVQDNKEYVPQAAQISKSATAVTNLLKTELEYIKLSKK